MKKRIMQARVLADRKELKQEQWHELRRQGIGGSDAGAIMGLSSFSSAFTVYAEKIGIRKPQEQNEAMRIGTDLEAYVAQRFMESTGKKVKNCNYVLQHPDHEWMIADVDRLVVGEDAGLECKTTSAYNKTNFERADIPPQYYAQCVHYMAVTGAKKWYISILVLGVGFYYFCIERNEEEIKALIELERAFWFDNVLSYTEPEVDGKPQTSAVINEMYIAVDNTSVDLLPHADILDRYIELKAQIEKLKEEKEVIQQQLQVYMANNTEGYTGNYKVTWKNQERSVIDSKRLQADHPEIYNQYLKKSYSRPFKITLKEDKIC